MANAVEAFEKAQRAALSRPGTAYSKMLSDLGLSGQVPSYVGAFKAQSDPGVMPYAAKVGATEAMLNQDRFQERLQDQNQQFMEDLIKKYTTQMVNPEMDGAIGLGSSALGGWIGEMRGKKKAEQQARKSDYEQARIQNYITGADRQGLGF